MNDVDRKAKNAAYMRKWRAKRLAQDPEYRFVEKQRNNKSRRRRRQNPDYWEKEKKAERIRTKHKRDTDPEYKATVNSKAKIWRDSHPEKMAERRKKAKEKRDNDPDFRAMQNEKNRISTKSKRLRIKMHLLERDGDFILPLWVIVPKSMIDIIQIDHVIPKQPLRKLGCPEEIVSHIDNTQLLLSGANNTKKCYWLCSDWLKAHAPDGYEDAIALAKKNEERAIAKIREWKPDFSIQMIISRNQ